MRASVILPVYNAAAHLNGCLDSILNQTFPDFEVIAVDDGSTDGSGALLDERASRCKILKVVHQRNQGQSVARNVALAAATGEYVLMVDADDLIHPRLLELTVAAADRARCDFVLFGHRDIVPAGIVNLLAEWSADAGAVATEQVPANAFEWFVESRRWPTPWQFLFRRDCLDGLTFIPGVIYEDVPFVLTFLSRRGRGVLLDKDLYGYVRHDGSTTHADNRERRLAGYEAGMRSLRAVLDERRYRLYVSCGCANWLRCLWRSFRSIPERDARIAAERMMQSFLSRCAADGLLRASDFSGLWKIRFLMAVWRWRGTR